MRKVQKNRNEENEKKKRKNEEIAKKTEKNEEIAKKTEKMRKLKKQRKMRKVQIGMQRSDKLARNYISTSENLFKRLLCKVQK